MQRSPDHLPISAKALAQALPPEAWMSVKWREGTNTDLTSRFAALRLRPASRDFKRSEPRALEWLLIEWPGGDPEPAKYWLSTLPADTTIAQLVDMAKLRWRIERDYQDLKQELGLGHYEGRGWRGFHHHASLCIAAYGFLISLRETIPPSAPAQPKPGSEPELPAYRRPHKSTGQARTAHHKLNYNHAPQTDQRPGATIEPMSMLQPLNKTKHQTHFVTQ